MICVYLLKVSYIRSYIIFQIFEYVYCILYTIINKVDPISIILHKLSTYIRLIPDSSWIDCVRHYSIVKFHNITILARYDFQRSVENIVSKIIIDKYESNCSSSIELLL